MEQIQTLIACLSREALVFEQFLSLLHEQRRYLVANDLAGLSACGERQREKLVEAQLLHRQRETILAGLRLTESAQDDLTLKRLIQVASVDQADQLRRIRETILQLNDQISSARTSNMLLIDRSREFIAKTLAMLAAVNQQHAYTGDQTPPASTGQLLVDRRG